MKLIVLNCYSRNSLAIIKSLDPSIEIIGGSVEQDGYLLCKPDRFFHHKRVRQIFRHRNPADDGEGFKEDIIEACHSFGADGIIASGTTITNYLSQYKKEIEAATKAVALVESYDKLEQLTDKWFTYQLAVELDIQAPFTVLLDGSETMYAELESLSFPAVVKPRKSFAAKGVQFFENREELQQWLSGASSCLDGSCIAQQKIEGALHDVTSCAQGGKPISLLSQKRLKSLYDFGGGGIINITTDEPVTRNYARAILEKMKWNGAAEFDFIKTPKGEYFLIECNPKIWGTTYLTVAAGMNVPQQTVDVFLGNKELKPVESYEVGLLYKWIFPECTFNWIQRPRHLRRIKERIQETFSDYGASRTLNNLNGEDILHLLGIVFDKAQL